MLKPKEDQELGYSPVGMGLDKYAGWGTLLFTSSKACNLSCGGCWTAGTNGLIKEQLKLGTQWLYDNPYGTNILETMLESFKEEKGQLVACMSDGEPLVPTNYEYILKLAESCGKHELPFLLFTNGILLTKEKLTELETATKGRISHCISLQAGDGKRYNKFHGKDLFEKIESNLPVWKEYNRKVLENTGKHGMAVHTYIISGKTTEADMESIKKVVERLGNVHWVVSTMGIHVSESLKGKSTKQSQETAKLIEKYNTGPTATLTLSQKNNKKICSYIAHSFYPPEQQKGVFGITFNPYYKGAVQTCPYHSLLSTSEWFTLKDHLDALQKSRVDITKEHVRKWLEYAIKTETLITKATFDLVGYEHCLMGHRRKNEIDLFIAGINVAMGKRKQKWNVVDNQYFDKVIAGLEETIESLINRKG